MEVEELHEAVLHYLTNKLKQFYEDLILRKTHF